MDKIIIAIVFFILFTAGVIYFAKKSNESTPKSTGKRGGRKDYNQKRHNL